MKSELDIEAEKARSRSSAKSMRNARASATSSINSRANSPRTDDRSGPGMMQSNGSTFFTNLGTSVRNNPVPAVLTSVGLLWLMISQNRPPVPQPTYRSGPDQDKAGEWADGLADGIDSARAHLHSTTDSLKDGYQSLKGKASHLGKTSVRRRKTSAMRCMTPVIDCRVIRKCSASNSATCSRSNR